jgi:DNA-binding response OmpR family regulator
MVGGAQSRGLQLRRCKDNFRMKAKILWIEGKRAEGPSFIPGLRKKGYDVDIVSTGRAALDRLLGIDPDLVVLNAASMRTSGKRICHSLRDQMDGLPIVVISGSDQEAPEDSGANVILTLPFTVRKLLNRIAPLLPGEGEHLLHRGPIRLDLERKRVRCQGREARLTPRLTMLLRILMQHPGEVVEREALFREVWNTEYIGDTRTLDVHISWLRQAIEENPRNPQFLKTFRGVGYRLDV